MGILILVLTIIMVWRLFSSHSPRQVENTDNTNDTQRVNKFIGMASFLMVAFIVVGELGEIQPASGVKTLMPSWENDLKLHKSCRVLLLAISFVLFVLIYIMPFWLTGNSKWRSGLRRGSNCALFVLAATGVFFWVAHTGGLTSLYGAAYLSLFSVAVVVPQRWIIKLGISTPVAAGAFTLAAMSSNVMAECYMCGLSIFGSFLGAAIGAFFNQ